jgi:hypothetical protein
MISRPREIYVEDGIGGLASLEIIDGECVAACNFDGRKIWKPIDKGRQTYGRHTDRGRLDAELAVSAVGLDLNSLALLVVLRPSEASQHDGEFLLR